MAETLVEEGKQTGLVMSEKDEIHNTVQYWIQQFENKRPGCGRYGITFYIFKNGNKFVRIYM